MPVGPSADPSAEAESQRPDWVGRPPQAAGDDYRTSITVGPYTTRAECDAKLPEEVQKALNQYVQTWLGERMPPGVVLPEADFRPAIVKEQREEVRQYSVGPMVNLHVLLEFDQAVKEPHFRGLSAGGRRPPNLDARRRDGLAAGSAGRPVRVLADEGLEVRS